MLEKEENKMFKVIGRVAEVLSNNQSLTAISQGFVKTMPVSLGLVLFSILGNLPIPAFTAWLSEVGIKESINAAVTVSSSLIALYISFSIAYIFVSKRKHSGITGGFISMASFILLIPQTVGTGDSMVSGIDFTYTGSQGIVIALIVSLLVSQLYCFLIERGLKIKLPKSVPSMVSESLEPAFVSMAIFLVIFVIRVIVSYTDFGSFYEMINQIIATPLMKVGTSIPAGLLILFLGNLFWFFGIHPSTIQGPYSPVLLMMVFDNIAKFQAGEPMLYVTNVLVYLIAGLGANGNTIGLLISMFTAKSKRYKSMLKISFVPHLFNINEPLIFGMPVILNPIFFIPMTFSAVITGLLTWVGLSIISISYNPLMEMLPWTTPVFIKYFFAGGFSLFVLVVFLIIVNVILYYPFFKMADKLALVEELELGLND